MNIVPFKMEKHYDKLRELFLSYDMEPVPPSFLPTVGFMTENEDAAAFVYQTDSAVCWIEPLIVGKELRREDRSLAIKSLTGAIEAEVSKKGFRYIMVMTDVATVSQRAEGLGYEKVSGTYNVLGKGI